MKRSASRRNLFATIWFAAITFVLFLLGGAMVTINQKPVQATASEYLQVKATDFQSIEVQDADKNWNITLNCDFDLAHTAFDYMPYGLEVDGETFCLYNGKGQTLTIINIAPGATSKSLVIAIRIKDGSTTLESAKDLNTIIIKKGSKISSPNTSTWLGIEFQDGLCLEKTEDDVWILKEPQIETEETTYELSLNETPVSLSWNAEKTLLEATVALPFTTQTQASYTATLTILQNGTPISFTAVQNAGESLLCLQLNGYAVPLDNEIPCICMQGGDLTDLENKVQVTVTGELCFYEYVDGSWATEKYVQIQETVLGKTTDRKLSVLEVYTFLKPQVQTDKLYVGWIFNGELLYAGETIALASYTKRSLNVEAVFLNYRLILGASIRYDEFGDSSGIRFGAKLSMEDFNGFKEYIKGVGIIVMPSDLLKSADFTLENYNASGEAKNFFIPNDSISSNKQEFTLYATLAKVLQTNYNRTFCARAYLLTQDGTYVWDSEMIRRSVYEVATSVMDEHKEKSTLKTWQVNIIETYLDGVANITYKNGLATVDTSALSPVITAVEAVENSGLVTLSLTTGTTRFACITYNGKRIKNANQSYQNGILTVTFYVTAA